MEGIGERLRKSREAKKLTINDISKETNISSKYIEAIENEDFEKLPSETHIVGFLRNYAEFLKEDSDEIIQFYKGFKIGESTTPLEELTKPTRPRLVINFSNIFRQYKNIIYIVGITSLVFLLVWLFTVVFSSKIDIKGGESINNIKNEYKATKENPEIEKIRYLKLSNDSGFALIYKSETVQFLVDNKEVMFLLKEIKDKEVLLELIPGNKLETIKIEKPKIIEIEGCKRKIIITLKGLTENRAKILVSLSPKKGRKTKSIVKKEENNRDTNNTRIIAQNKKNLQIVFEARFIRKTYLELYLDGNLKRKGLISAGTIERWEASEYIQLKIGNAGGLKAKINGKPFTFGQLGQVTNKIITWKKDLNNPNLYYIVIKDW